MRKRYTPYPPMPSAVSATASRHLPSLALSRAVAASSAGCGAPLNAPLSRGCPGGTRLVAARATALRMRSKKQFTALVPFSGDLDVGFCRMFGSAATICTTRLVVCASCPATEASSPTRSSSHGSAMACSTPPSPPSSL